MPSNTISTKIRLKYRYINSLVAFRTSIYKIIWCIFDIVYILYLDIVGAPLSIRTKISPYFDSQLITAGEQYSRY